MIFVDGALEGDVQRLVGAAEITDGGEPVLEQCGEYWNGANGLVGDRFGDDRLQGATCWRRLRDRAEAGVRPRLHELLLAELRRTGLLDMEDAAVHGSHVRALRGGLTPDLRRSTVVAPAASTM